MHKVEARPASTLEQRAASTAGGGTSLSTTPALITIPFGSTYMSLTPRDFLTAIVAQYTLNPYLEIVHTTDLLVSASGFTHLSDEMQDGDTADNNFAVWDTLANGSALYVGSELPFRGVKVDIGTTPNAVASVLTIKYWDAGAWTDIVNSEGTKTATECLSQDGDETWTVPSAWKKDSLYAIGETVRSDGPFRTPMYWTRWEVSAALTADMDIISILPYNRATTYAELLEGQVREMSLSDRQSSVIEALVDAGSGKLVVNVDAAIKEFE